MNTTARVRCEPAGDVEKLGRVHHRLGGGKAATSWRKRCRGRPRARDPREELRSARQFADELGSIVSTARVRRQHLAGRREPRDDRGRGDPPMTRTTSSCADAKHHFDGHGPAPRQQPQTRIVTHSRRRIISPRACAGPIEGHPRPRLLNWRPGGRRIGPLEAQIVPIPGRRRARATFPPDGCSLFVILRAERSTRSRKTPCSSRATRCGNLARGD